MKLLFVSVDRTEVGLLSSIMDGAGIEFEIRNEAMNSNYPTGPFYPELWVIHDDDFSKAVELRDAWRTPPSGDQGSWTCPGCGEQLEGQFTTCWKCGVARGENAK